MCVIGYSTVRVMFAAKLFFLLLLLVIRLPQSRQKCQKGILVECLNIDGERERSNSQRYLNTKALALLVGLYALCFERA